MTDVRLRTELFIENLEIDAWIGVHHHEHGRTQRVRLDITVVIDQPSMDMLADTVDYDAIRHMILDIASAGHYELVETFAKRILESVLNDQRVASIDVRIAKLEAMTGAAQSAGARMTGTRL